MIVLDTSAWIEVFRGTAQAGEFERAVADDTDLLIPSIVCYEVRKYLLRANDPANVAKAEHLFGFGEQVGLARSLAESAAATSLQHKLPMADAIIYATARIYHATLWTQDQHFEHLPGVQYVAKQAPPAEPAP